MCGIGGIHTYGGGRPVSESEGLALRDAMSHRGPDDAGAWWSEDRTVCLVHRRLSIIDLSARGHQPMASADGRHQIVFNGEIYNFQALRRDLEQLGHRFHSDSDTEVVLNGYREWGVGVLDRLRGMFAFAAHDLERRETFLARDPLGIKPLYWADDGNRIEFASEIGAIRAVSDAGAIDWQGLFGYLQWGTIPAPHTLYRRIHCLPPASWLRIDSTGTRGPVVYYRPEEDLVQQPAIAAGDALTTARTALLDSVRHHLIADVPVGAFLSGGVDSPSLVGLLAEVHEGPVETVNLAFDVPGFDESRLARSAARLYGANHHEVQIRIDEIRQRLPEAIRGLDQPTLDGVNVYFVSEAAVAAGLKVAVSGVGGDELFGGYESFQRIPRIRRLRSAIGPFAPLLARSLPLLRRLGPGARVMSKAEMALRYARNDCGAYFAEKGLFSHADLRRLLVPDLHEALDAWDPVAELSGRVRLDGVPTGDRVSILEIRQYLQMQLLRDADAASMQHSLELRTPLVDRELFRALFRISAADRTAGPAKSLLRQSPSPPLPADLWNRRKQGFTFPFEAWLRDKKVDLALPRAPWLNPRGVDWVERSFRAGRMHWSRLWMLLVLGAFTD